MKKAKQILCGSILAVYCLAASALAADQIVSENPCSVPVQNMTVEEGAPDGTAYYRSGAQSADLPGWGGELQSECIWEADVKFTQAGAGFSLVSADGQRFGTCVRALERDGKLTLAMDGGTGSYYIWYQEVDKDTWYHVKLMGKYGAADGMIDLVFETYGADGKVTDSKSYYVILMNDMYASSGVGPEHIRVEPETCIDNVKVTKLCPDALQIKLPATSIRQGSTVRLDVQALREGSPFGALEEAVTYTIADAAGNPVEGITVEDGILKIGKQVQPQIISLTAQSMGLRAQKNIQVAPENPFEIVQVMFNEDYTVLEELQLNKTSAYNGAAQMVGMLYDASGSLESTVVKKIHAGLIEEGEQVLPVDYPLPESFDKETWKLKIGIWSTGEEAISIEKGPVALAQQPFEEEGQLFVPVRAFFDKTGGSVEWVEDTRTVVALAGNQSAAFQIGHNKAFLGEEKKELSLPVVIREGSTYVPAGFFEEMLDCTLSYNGNEITVK